MLRTEGEMPLVGEIARRHPDLKIAIDHMGAAHYVKDDAAFAYMPDLLALARYPNISVKATAVPFYTTDLYPFRNMHKYIRQVFDAFGPQRLFWGSDLTRLSCSYRESIALFTEELSFLSAHDKQLVMGSALSNWLGWECLATGSTLG